MPGLAEKILRGDVRAAARLMRLVDDGEPEATAELRQLFLHTGRAYVVGVTGPPGAGKSTLTDRLIAKARKAGRTVGVLAVDPSSPFSGGAILGDRIRMQEHATDPGVFIRSLATRGALGGLSRATGDSVRILDAMGKDLVIIETVGVGQDEIDIAQLAHTTVLVVVPGMGDDIQVIKAGILEIADLFAVNKADLDGADRVVRDLRAMLELRHAVQLTPADHDRKHRKRPAEGSLDRAIAPKDPKPPVWEPEIVKVVATRDEGVGELWSAIEKHRAFLDSSGERTTKDNARALAQFVALLRERLFRRALARLEREQGRLDEVAREIARREVDPYELAESLAKSLEE